MTARGPRPRRLLSILLPFILVVIVGLAVYLPWELGKSVVPDLAGMTVSEATAALDGVQLVLQPDAAVAPELAAFTVVDAQQPPAGARAVAGTVVTVTSHRIEVAVPDLAGMPLKAARTALAALGLSPVLAAAVVPDDIVPKAAQAALDAAGLGGADGVPAAPPAPERIGEDWAVAAQDPVPGTTAIAGSEVAITVVVPFVKVPDLKGKPYAAAVSTLEELGLDASGLADEGVVTKQQPAAGTPWVRGAKVEATLRHYVRYEAEATVRTGWLQWQAPDTSAIKVDAAATLPWSRTWWDTTSYGHLVVNWKFVGRGTASCRIIVDGEVVSQQSFTGLTPVITCG